MRVVRMATWTSGEPVSVSARRYSVISADFESFVNVMSGKGSRPTESSLVDGPTFRRAPLARARYNAWTPEAGFLLRTSGVSHGRWVGVAGIGGGRGQPGIAGIRLGGGGVGWSVALAGAAGLWVLACGQAHVGGDRPGP